MKKLLIIIAVLFCAIRLSYSQVVKRNVFVGENETWLLFPHLEFSTYTYTTKCSPTIIDHTIEHKQFKTISSLTMDNSCHRIDIFDQPEQQESKFYYAKLTEEGLCSVYHVNGPKVIHNYQFDAGKYFSSVLMMNQLNVLIWNSKEFMKIQYSLFSKKINTYQMEFPSEDYRQCSLNTANSVWCWKEDELLFLDFLNDNLQVSTFPYTSEPIVQIFPLSPQDNAIFICGRGSCNISVMERGQILVKGSFPFVGNVMGGSIHDQTNNFIIVTTDSVNLYSFNFYETIEIKLLDVIDFPQEFECAHYDSSVLLTNMMIIECFDFTGRQMKIVFLKDLRVDSYFAFNPIERSNFTDCWISGNKNYLLLIYNDQVLLKNTNFYYLSLSKEQREDSIDLKCIRYSSTDSKDETNYLITVENAYCGKVYINEPVSIPKEIAYNQYVSLQLNRYFKASDIVKYRFQSNCSFIQPSEYNSVVYQQYFSLYNRQKCIQILAGGGQLFYRLIQINETLFYLEECLPMNVGYGCQLINIYDKVISLRMAFLNSQLMAFYIQNQKLKMEHNKEVQQIFEEDVYQFQIQDQVLIVSSKEKKKYFNRIKSAVLRHRWVPEEAGFRYFYQGSSVLSLHANGTVFECSDLSHKKRTLSEIGPEVLEQTTFGEFSLPYLIRTGDFMFVINFQTITKKYVGENTYDLYTQSFNEEGRKIQNVRLTYIYITIEYEGSGFQIFDTSEEAISSRIANIKEEVIMTDIIVLYVKSILIPIQSTTTLIKIERDPTFSIGQFSPKYSLFHEYCNFKILLERGNGSCLQVTATEGIPDSEVHQEFLLKIRYQIEEIDLDVNIEIQDQPDQCSNCLLKLKQENYLGPIFAYDLNDDYYEQFLLLHHLTIEECLPKDSQILKGMLQVKFEGDYVSEEVMMMDGSSIYLMNRNLKIQSIIEMRQTTFCSSYLKIEEKYLIVCHKYFLLIDSKEIKASYLHNLTLTYQNRQSLQLQSQEVNTNKHIIILLDHDITAHIYELSVEAKTMEHLDNYNFVKIIDDLKIVNGKVIILKQRNICISDTIVTQKWVFQDSAVQYCFPLSDIIPDEYSQNYDYEAFLPYFSSSSLVKALIIARDVNSLHIDMEIDFSSSPFAFKIINVYAGYKGFGLIDIISVNKTVDSYSYFILLYQSQYNSEQIVAYYKYNSRYGIDGTIGQIRSAEILQNYFRKPFNLTFAPFSGQMYITNFNQSQPEKELGKKAGCISLKVKDQLEILLNYDQIPPLKFLILQARNLNQMSTHFIRIRFFSSSDQLWEAFVCLAVVLLLFVGLVVATNRCKNTVSDLQTDLMIEVDMNRSDEVESERELSSPSSKESQFQSRQSTSLLHSKESDFVDSSQDNANSQSVIIIRGDE